MYVYVHVCEMAGVRIDNVLFFMKSYGTCKQHKCYHTVKMTLQSDGSYPEIATIVVGIKPRIHIVF